jgi:cytochrome P450
MNNDAGTGSQEGDPLDATPPVDMRDPAFRHDPHPLLRAIRERARVSRDVLGIWLVCGHADTSAGLRSTQLSREPWRMPIYARLRPFIADSTLERTTEQWMLFNDPPKHTRLRRLVNGAFKPPVIEALRERIGAVTDDLLAALPAPTQHGAEFDLMTGLAQLLPVRVICDVLGLPPEDFAQTKAWSDTLAWIVEPVIRKEQRIAAAQAAEGMAAYLRRHMAQRRAAPRRDDLLGLLIAAHDDDAALSEDELLGNLILLFIAGHETTTNLIGNGLLTLLRHPAELARLRAEPALVHGAVDEMLRFEGSVTTVSRHTTAPYAIGDTVIPPDDTLFFMVGAANRDPAVFADPDRFDIGRTPNPHMGFGAGIHYCLGAPLARLEAEIAFTRLLQRYPALALVDEAPQWRGLINLRGLQALRLKVGDAAAIADPGLGVRAGRA